MPRPVRSGPLRLASAISQSYASDARLPKTSMLQLKKLSTMKRLESLETKLTWQPRTRPSWRPGAVVQAHAILHFMQLAEADAKAPLVSVIVPAYRAAQFIAATLDSILAQTCARKIRARPGPGTGVFGCHGANTSRRSVPMICGRHNSRCSSSEAGSAAWPRCCRPAPPPRLKGNSFEELAQNGVRRDSVP